MAAVVLRMFALSIRVSQNRLIGLLRHDSHLGCEFGVRTRTPGGAIVRGS